MQKSVIFVCAALQRIPLSDFRNFEQSDHFDGSFLLYFFESQMIVAERLRSRADRPNDEG